MIKKVNSVSGFFICILIVFITTCSHSQNSTGLKFSFSQGDLTFSPAIANISENRTGLIKDFNSSKIRLDIGFSPDILDFNFYENNNITEKISAGGDFHAFGLLFNESENIILQVDAIDALFGGHISYKKMLKNSSVAARFRIMHLSSHLVDGHFDLLNYHWKDGKNPMAFGREFMDLTLNYSIGNSNFYLGADYIFRQRPEVLSKNNYEISIDHEIKNIIAESVNLYISCDFKLSGIDQKYCGNNCLQSGFRFGEKVGMDLFIFLYSGNSYYGEYYNDKLFFLGAGINFFFK